MKEKDKLTQKVFDMYQQYPFPDIDYKWDKKLNSDQECEGDN